MQEKKEQKVSIGGWIGTLLLSAIPGVNLIAWVVWAIAAKLPSRKTFAIAQLILTAVLVLLVVAAISLYGTQLLDWARSIDPELFTPKAAG